MPGTLFVVATPIGNLEDLTFRALRILKEVDLIAAEDTRRTAKLLVHYEIRKPMVSLREHNEVRESPRLVGRMEAGERIALVSDAGTPGIADPGARLVRLARERGIAIVPIPGPSAVTTLLSVSGLEQSEFTFLGFPPSHGQRRRDWFEALKDEDRAIVILEAPHRIESTLSDLAEQLVKRHIIIGREMTKMNESIGHITNYGASHAIKPIGEFTVVILPPLDGTSSDIAPSDESVGLDVFDDITNHTALGGDKAIIAASSITGIKRSTLRNALKKRRIAAKRQSS